tara:strand:+ start:258 stop:677 length:420 start_codon:yes stop_codon:yes gene_type:complete
MSDKNLKEGDLIIVSGETIKKGMPIEHHYALAKVLAVGSQDVFAVSEDSRPIIFRVSLSRCTPVPVIETAQQKIKEASIGDLVMSVTDRFGKIEKRVGFIVEINSMPGKHSIAKILDGDKEHTVMYDSLIVLGEHQNVH